MPISRAWSPREAREREATDGSLPIAGLHPAGAVRRESHGQRQGRLTAAGALLLALDTAKLHYDAEMAASSPPAGWSANTCTTTATRRPGAKGALLSSPRAATRISPPSSKPRSPQLRSSGSAPRHVATFHLRSRVRVSLIAPHPPFKGTSRIGDRRSNRAEAHAARLGKLDQVVVAKATTTPFQLRQRTGSGSRKLLSRTANSALGGSRR